MGEDITPIVAKYRQHLGAQPNRNGAHLTNLALAMLKYLALRGESDTIRLQATRTMLELPLVQERLGMLTQRLRSIHQHIHIEATGKEVTARLQKALENGGDNAKSALIEAIMAENLPEEPK